MATMPEIGIAKRPESAAARAERTRSGRCYRPNVDIIETDDALLILADMPGLHCEDIEIHFENGTLTLCGQVRERQPKETDYLLREYGVGDFLRTFAVSEAIDDERITAEYGDGVLTLHLPKVEEVRPRRIPVSAK